MDFKRLTYVLLSLSCVTAWSKSKIAGRTRNVRKFPPGFLFGAATSAYQVEGAWNEQGKSENIWDYLTHNYPSLIKGSSNGDIACDSYHQYKRDVEMMRELGLDYYRFSLSWTRLLPTSFPDQINKAGVTYYDNLINEMLKYNIEPVITLYHWDLPQKLQEMGGWTNPHIVDWFADYARVAYRLFGDRVKYWITMNEPQQVCLFGYGMDKFAPGLNITGIAEYLCAKNLLMAHAIAYHIYDEEFRSSLGGSIFIALHIVWYAPDTVDDAFAAEEASQFQWGLYAHPIFSKNGDFPPIVKITIAAKSLAQGFHRSRLPLLTPEEVDYIKGTSDFLGINHYTTFLAYRYDTDTDTDDSKSINDMDVKVYQSSKWGQEELSALKVVPWGLYNILMKIKNEFNNPPVFISENGFATHEGLEDDDRVSDHRQYVSAMLDAIEEGADVRAYTFWSLMDNFEWIQGYTLRFGLYEVDYESPRRTRTPRKSAFVYKELLRTRVLDPSYEPVTTVMTIDQGH